MKSLYTEAIENSVRSQLLRGYKKARKENRKYDFVVQSDNTNNRLSFRLNRIQ